MTTSPVKEEGEQSELSLENWSVLNCEAQAIACNKWKAWKTDGNPTIGRKMRRVAMTHAALELENARLNRICESMRPSIVKLHWPNEAAWQAGHSCTGCRGSKEGTSRRALRQLGRPKTVRYVANNRHEQTIKPQRILAWPAENGDRHHHNKKGKLLSGASWQGPDAPAQGESVSLRTDRPTIAQSRGACEWCCEARPPSQ